MKSYFLKKKKGNLKLQFTSQDAAKSHDKCPGEKIERKLVL